MRIFRWSPTCFGVNNRTNNQGAREKRALPTHRFAEQRPHALKTGLECRYGDRNRFLLIFSQNFLQETVQSRPITVKQLTRCLFLQRTNSYFKTIPVLQIKPCNCAIRSPRADRKQSSASIIISSSDRDFSSSSSREISARPPAA